MAETPRTVRCAVYTRKSTEEGLEQEFNSLQAQREAAEAYILSQRQLGWTALAEEYSDGGFTGANLDRPALRRLLADVEARQIDCVVVYKVDRLSRSLLDFAQLMSLFDRYGISFVSVTQDFNTTTSLGRLTLHILLSFAQFEREIISERTRDKVSAARRKGKWTGGIPILGYDVDPRGGRLIVNQDEARRVRQIFAIAARKQTLAAILEEVNRAGWKTKEWTSRRGKHHPGRHFSKTSLGALLGNVLYTGSILHKGKVYPGEQEALIDPQPWESIQQKLQTNGRHQRGRPHSKQVALLRGLLYCACGRPMLPTFAVAHGRRYGYYVCEAAGGNNKTACSQSRVARADLETSLLGQLELVLGAPPVPEAVGHTVERVTFAGRARQVTVTFRDATRLDYTLPVPVRPGVKAGSKREAIAGRLPRVSRVIALAIKFLDWIQKGRASSYAEVARRGQVTRSRMSQILSLNNLAPTIQETLLFLPKTLEGADRVTEKKLRNIARTIDWEAQRAVHLAWIFSRYLARLRIRTRPRSSSQAA